MSEFTIRTATADDAGVIRQFIYELAVYENEPEIVEATPESLKKQLASDDPPFECVIGEQDGEPVGFALFFRNYSTWTGQSGLSLEDLYVRPEHRGKGYGALLLGHLAKIAIERGWPRVDWQVLDWNTPSIEFYSSIDSEIRRDWIPCRLSGQALQAMAARTH